MTEQEFDKLLNEACESYFPAASATLPERVVGHVHRSARQNAAVLPCLVLSVAASMTLLALLTPRAGIHLDTLPPITPPRAPLTAEIRPNKATAQPLRSRKRPFRPLLSQPVSAEENLLAVLAERQENEARFILGSPARQDTLAPIVIEELKPITPLEESVENR